MPAIQLPGLLVRSALIAVLLVTGWIAVSNSSRIEAQFGQCDYISTDGTCTILSPTDPPSAIGLDVTVSGMVPETAISLQGYSAPGAFILVTESGNVVGAGTANAAGEFNFHLTALQAGSTYSIEVMGAMSGYPPTPGVGFVVTPASNTVTEVSNIIIPPFIKATPSAANYGDPIVISGLSTPGADLTLFVEPGSHNKTMTVNPDGTWELDVVDEFGPLDDGGYKATAIVSVNSALSGPSNEVLFEVRPVDSMTFLQVNGYGPPGAFLTFREGNEVVASGVVMANGRFSTTIQYPDANASLDMGVFADDGNQTTPLVAFTAELESTETTVVEDILLPTFIEVNPETVASGDPVTASGLTVPDAEIDLKIASPVQNTTVTVDGTGNWSQEILSVFGTLAEGVYTVSAIVNYDDEGLTSIPSREVKFTVQEAQTATDLVVEGFGPPNAFITFTENNLVIGSDTIAADGTFSHTLKFSDQTQPHTISVVASDGQQQTPPTTFTITVSANDTTTVSNVALPTFIEVVPNKVPYGNTVMAKGRAVPNSLVQVFVRTPLRDKMVTSGADGTWQLDLNTLDGMLNKGQYTAYARTTVLPQSYQSGLSREVDFEVVEENDCAERRSDLNCDKRVDITDLGILIFYWGNAGAGQKADINRDGVVDISDVGIMVYDWTY